MDSPLGSDTAVLNTSTNLEWLKLSATAGQTPTRDSRTPRREACWKDTAAAPSTNPPTSCSDPSCAGRMRLYKTLEKCRCGAAVHGALWQVVRLGWAVSALSLEGQIPQVYGEIWHATRLTDALLIDVDTQVANLQPARPADHWLVHQVPEPSTLVLLSIAALALATRIRRAKRNDGASLPGFLACRLHFTAARPVTHCQFSRLFMFVYRQADCPLSRR